jgi:hypothetical protein
MVTYRVKPERVQENEELIRAVYAELAEIDPEGLSYVTFKQPDGVSFVHIAVADTSDGRTPLQEVPAFQRFVAEIADRCDEPPVTQQLDEVGSFRAFAPRVAALPE